MTAIKPGRLWRCSLTLLLAASLVGCGDGEPTGPKLHPQDCLKAMSLATLPAAIQACDAVIQAYPRDPLPRKDRALLWSLQGEDTKACKDLEQARSLAAQQPTSAASRRMLADLMVSLRPCHNGALQPRPEQTARLD